MNDGLLFRITGIPKRVETASPWGNFAIVSQENETRSPKDSNYNDGTEKELLELLRRYVASYQLSERQDLK